jgi:uncharacterized protein YqgV (UPF0045/DUF77 family)
MAGPGDVPVMAEIALYALREPRLSPALTDFLAALKAPGLEVSPGPMSTLVRGEADRVFGALRAAFREVAGTHQVVMRVVMSNACPSLDDIPECHHRDGEV